MSELTDHVPKALFPYLDRTIIDSLIENYFEAGTNRISIGVGWKGEEIETMIKRRYHDTPIQCVPVPSYEVGPLQTLVTVANTIEDEELLISPADLMAPRTSISEFVSVARNFEDWDAILAVDKIGGSGTVVTYDNEFLVTDIGSGTSRSAMMLLVSPQFLNLCRSVLMNGSTRVSDALKIALEQGLEVRAAEISGSWFDVDTLEQLLAANLAMLEEPGSIPGAISVPRGDVFEVGQRVSFGDAIQIKPGVRIVGPTLISGRVSIDSDSNIGPSVCIQGDCRMSEGCAISESLIFGKSRLKAYTKVAGSIIHNSRIYH